MSAKAIIATLPTKIRQDAEKAVWEDYVAQCLRVITENTAKAVQGGYVTKEYRDIIHPQTSDKTADEIIDELIANAEIEVIE